MTSTLPPPAGIGPGYYTPQPTFRAGTLLVFNHGSARPLVVDVDTIGGFDDAGAVTVNVSPVPGRSAAQPPLDGVVHLVRHELDHESREWRVRTPDATAGDTGTTDILVAETAVQVIDHARGPVIVDAMVRAVADLERRGHEIEQSWDMPRYDLGWVYNRLRCARCGVTGWIRASKHRPNRRVGRQPHTFGGRDVSCGTVAEREDDR